MVAHGVNTTTVEIDPVVYEYAARFFDLAPNPNAVTADAVSFVADARHTGLGYDYIIHDVFTGGAEPVDLFTCEFLAGLRDLLTTDGSVAIVSPSASYVHMGSLVMEYRTTPETCSLHLPGSSSAPSAPSFRRVESSVKTQCQGRRELGVILPTWWSSVPRDWNRSSSATRSKRTSWAVMPGGTFYYPYTKSIRRCLRHRQVTAMFCDGTRQQG